MTERLDALERSLRDGPADERGYRFQPLEFSVAARADGAPSDAVRRRAGQRSGSPTRPTFAGPSFAAVLVVALALAGLAVVVRPDQSGMDTPGASLPPTALPSLSPSPSPSGSLRPTPTPLPIPAFTETFVSARNGFSISYPAGWSVKAATKSWPPDIFLPGGNPALDELQKPGEARVSAASQRLGVEQTPEAWIAAYVRPYEGARPCGVPVATAPRIPIGELSGYLDVAECPAAGDSTFSERDVGYDVIAFSGGRVYQFSVGGNVDLAYVEAILATVRFDPEHALDP